MDYLDKNNIDPADVDYVIECSEEACGDMNQRGGGNFAKAIAEEVHAINASGSDTRSFCAAPTHALIEAAALVKSGVSGRLFIKKICLVNKVPDQSFLYFTGRFILSPLISVLSFSEFDKFSFSAAIFTFLPKNLGIELILT